MATKSNFPRFPLFPINDYSRGVHAAAIIASSAEMLQHAANLLEGIGSIYAKDTQAAADSAAKTVDELTNYLQKIAKQLQ